MTQYTDRGYDIEHSGDYYTWVQIKIRVSDVCSNCSKEVVFEDGEIELRYNNDFDELIKKFDTEKIANAIDGYFSKLGDNNSKGSRKAKRDKQGGKS